MSMIGLGLFPFLTYYLYVIVPLAPLVYLFIKWRDYRNGLASDPWLGAAVILQYFWTLALQLALFGMTLALAGLIKGRNADELNPGLGLLTCRIDRPARGLLCPEAAAAFGAAVAVLEGFQRPQPAAVRPGGLGRPERVRHSAL